MSIVPDLKNEHEIFRTIVWITFLINPLGLSFSISQLLGIENTANIVKLNLDFLYVFFAGIVFSTFMFVFFMETRNTSTEVKEWVYYAGAGTMIASIFCFLGGTFLGIYFSISFLHFHVSTP